MRVGAVEPRFPPPSSSLSSATPAAKPAAGAEGPSPFAQVLGNLGREIAGGESTLRHAAGAGAADLGPAELIALQASVYRYSEAIDLASKLVDHATSGVKTVVQGQ